MKRIVACIIILSAITGQAKSNKCCGIPQIQSGIINLQNIQSRILALINTIIDDLPSTACNSTPITAATTIASPGNYCLANDITGNITISSANVSLNFNGFALTGALTISGSNAQVYNGTIIGTGSGNGILISNGISDITILNMNISNADTGIRANTNTNVTISHVISHNNTGQGALFLNQTNLIVDSSIFSDQTAVTAFNGLEIRTSTNVLVQNSLFLNNANDGFVDHRDNQNIVVQNCIANSNTDTGFFIGSNDIIVNECKAIANGIGFDLAAPGQISVLNSIATNNASQGFIVSAGDPVLFWVENCTSSNNSVGFSQNATNATGTFKSCSATNNTGCGFNDVGNAGNTVAQYVANYASQNNSGASNYCLAGIANDTPYGPAVAYNTAGTSSWINVFAP